MAAKPPRRTTKPPADRSTGGRYFYPAEVVAILGLEGIDYAQLRRLFRLVRADPNERTSGWSRYTFEDLVAVRVAVRLCGGRGAFRPGSRVQIRELEQACAGLRALGVERPLVQVAMRREGNAIVADFEGLAFRPATGQLALDARSREVVHYLARVVRIPLSDRREFRHDLYEVRSRLESRAAHRRRPEPAAAQVAW